MAFALLVISAGCNLGLGLRKPKGIFYSDRRFPWPLVNPPTAAPGGDVPLHVGKTTRHRVKFH